MHDDRAWVSSGSSHMAHTHEELVKDPIEVAGAIAIAHDRKMEIADPERRALINGLWSTFDRLEIVLGLDRQELADVMGCDAADPFLWLEADLPTLRRSEEIVAFLFRQVQPDEDKAPERETAKIALWLAVETVSRCRGDVGTADFVLNQRGDETGESPLSLVHGGRMGRARKVMVARVAQLAAELAERRATWRGDAEGDGAGPAVSATLTDIFGDSE